MGKGLQIVVSVSREWTFSATHKIVNKGSDLPSALQLKNSHQRRFKCRLNPVLHCYLADAANVGKPPILLKNSPIRPNGQVH